MNATAHECTLKWAIAVLLEHTERDFIGAGCGIRSLPNAAQRQRAVIAIKRAWKYVSGREVTEEELYKIVRSQ